MTARLILTRRANGFKPISSRHKAEFMALPMVSPKSMTFGEGGSALAFTALALLSIVIAAKAYTPGYAFHAYLFSAASLATVFAIFNRYFERPAQLPPLMIAGKPNYNMGPVKFASIAAMFWGIA